ncbi:MAG: 3-hydroxyacyl-ACP dehydratase FabZ [Flavobacteriaceae bacterium]
MAEETRTLDSAGIMRVLQLLPHRYPFLMIDKIIEMDGDESGIGIKNVTINEPHFQGHFPGNPVMPGVLLLEGMAQTAGALCIHDRMKNGGLSLVYLMTIDKARFRKPVMPGDQVRFVVRKLRNRGLVWRFGCVAEVDGVKVAEAEVSATLGAAEGQ